METDKKRRILEYLDSAIETCEKEDVVLCVVVEIDDEKYEWNGEHLVVSR